MRKTHKNARLLELLLVDDNPADERYLREILADGGLANRLTAMRDGDSAMRYLRGEGEFSGAVKPDVVLLDLNMPGKDGRRVLTEIRADPLLNTLPVIILTSSSSSRDSEAAYELHADAYMTKPPDLWQLLRAVMSVGDFGIGLVQPAPAPSAGRGKGGA